jgi:hypothetical protein
VPYGDLTGRRAGRGYGASTQRRALPVSFGPRFFVAQYPGTCCKCDRKIQVGDKISRWSGSKYSHTRCL